VATTRQGPFELATDEFTREVTRLLRSGGLQLLNVSDGSSLIFTRQIVATVSEVFPFVMPLAQPAVITGRRFSNIVAASRVPLPDPASGPIRRDAENEDRGGRA
jgi:spermidine synthase